MLGELASCYQFSQMGFDGVSVRAAGGHHVGHCDVALLLSTMMLSVMS